MVLKTLAMTMNNDDNSTTTDPPPSKPAATTIAAAVATGMTTTTTTKKKKKTELSRTTTEISSSPTTNHVMYSQRLQFPGKLHRLLDDAEKEGTTHIVSWMTNRSFKVHDSKDFAAQILPRYFSTTTYKSFQRNLNLWGFTCVAKGPTRGVCMHPYFVKGDEGNLSHHMKRSQDNTRAKCNSKRTHSSMDGDSSYAGSDIPSDVVFSNRNPPGMMVDGDIPQHIGVGSPAGGMASNGISGGKKKSRKNSNVPSIPTNERSVTPSTSSVGTGRSKKNQKKKLPTLDVDSSSLLSSATSNLKSPPGTSASLERQQSSNTEQVLQHQLQQLIGVGSNLGQQQQQSSVARAAAAGISTPQIQGQLQRTAQGTNSDIMNLLLQLNSQQQQRRTPNHQPSLQDILQKIAQTDQRSTPSTNQIDPHGMLLNRILPTNTSPTIATPSLEFLLLKQQQQKEQEERQKQQQQQQQQLQLQSLLRQPTGESNPVGLTEILQLAQQQNAQQEQERQRKEQALTLLSQLGGVSSPSPSIASPERTLLQELLQQQEGSVRSNQPLSLSAPSSSQALSSLHRLSNQSTAQQLLQTALLANTTGINPNRTHSYSDSLAAAFASAPNSTQQMLQQQQQSPLMAAGAAAAAAAASPAAPPSSEMSDEQVVASSLMGACKTPQELAIVTRLLQRSGVVRQSAPK